jgi:hypothetical protein
VKKSIFILISLALISSSCFAFGILTTAPTVGKDNYSVQVQYSSVGFSQYGTNGSFAGLGTKLSYGITKDLDVFGELWTGSEVVSDFSISDAGSALGVGLKYSILKIVNNDPFDLAGFIDLSSMNTNHLTWGMNTVGVSASKMIKPQLTVYGIAAAMMNNWKIQGFKSVSETDTEFGIGVKYDVNKTVSVLGEVDRFWMDTNLFQSISVAVEWAL